VAYCAPSVDGLDLDVLLEHFYDFLRLIHVDLSLPSYEVSWQAVTFLVQLQAYLLEDVVCLRVLANLVEEDGAHPIDFVLGVHVFKLLLCLEARK
jgi:hypothetical protein